VATVPLLEGITDSWLGELELLELLELELGLIGRQGGTIRVVTLLLAGSTS
jgi:hypothetical protein